MTSDRHKQICKASSPLWQHMLDVSGCWYFWIKCIHVFFLHLRLKMNFMRRNPCGGLQSFQLPHQCHSLVACQAQTVRVLQGQLLSRQPQRMWRPIRRKAPVHVRFYDVCASLTINCLGVNVCMWVKTCLLAAVSILAVSSCADLSIVMACDTPVLCPCVFFVIYGINSDRGIFVCIS